MASKKGLGRGMGALLGDFEETAPEQNGYQKLPIYKVEPNPHQPRRDRSGTELRLLPDYRRRAALAGGQTGKPQRSAGGHHRG